MVPLNGDTVTAIALGLGAALGLGLWLVIATMPRFGRPRLAERIAPSIADLSAEARELVERRRADPASVVEAMFSPTVAAAQRGLGRLLGGGEVVQRRLRQAGAAISVDRFRAEQLGWAVVGFVLGGSAALVGPGLMTLPAPLRLLLPVIAGATGALARDRLLRRAANRRLTRISEELPTVLEFLALSLTAGEGLLDAIRRVARAGTGALPTELASVAAATATGVPLSTALARLRDDLDHPALTRCLDQVLGAIERGAPLAAVLRAQAGDARDETKRVLIELAGRKEVAMLFPLVFLILPVTVAFALYPGYLVLQTGF